MTQSLNSFCSNYFYCCSCLAEDQKLTKGSVRYDSLVLCDKHNDDFKPVMQELRSVFDKLPKDKVLIINDLGLGS